jgi:ferredoxin-fold anticodon binding domain-containing protein
VYFADYFKDDYIILGKMDLNGKEIKVKNLNIQLLNFAN